MGGGWSIPFWPGDTKAGSALTQSPESYVLVPPVMSQDRSEPDRYAQSSFDWLYQKREMAMLLADSVTPGVQLDAKLVPTDEHLSTSAVLAFPNVTWKGLWDRSAGHAPHAWAPAAALRIRAQMDARNPHTFASIYYSQLKVNFQLRDLVCPMVVATRDREFQIIQLIFNRKWLFHHILISSWDI